MTDPSNSSSNPYESPEHAGVTKPSDEVRKPVRGGPINDFELLGVVVRALGLYAMWTGFANGSSAYFPAAGYSFANYAMPAIVDLLLGAALFFGADMVVATAYRNRPATPIPARRTS